MLFTDENIFTVATRNKSSAVTEMGDRGHNRHRLKRGERLCPLRGELGPRLKQCGLDRGLLPYEWRLHPSSRLATTDMGQTLGGVGVPFFWGELGPHRTQSRLGRGLPPYQVAP